VDPAPSDLGLCSTLFPWVRSTGRFVGRGYGGKGEPTGHPIFRGPSGTQLDSLAPTASGSEVGPPTATLLGPLPISGRRSNGVNLGSPNLCRLMPGCHACNLMAGNHIAQKDFKCIKLAFGEVRYTTQEFAQFRILDPL